MGRPAGRWGAEGWPDDVLVDTQVVIEERPTFARHGSLGRTPELSACWSGEEPVGSRLRIRAGFLADLFNPPFLSTVTGVVQRIRDRDQANDEQTNAGCGSRVASGSSPMCGSRRDGSHPLAVLVPLSRRSASSSDWTSFLTRSGRSPSGRGTRPRIGCRQTARIPWRSEQRDAGWPLCRHGRDARARA